MGLKPEFEALRTQIVNTTPMSSIFEAFAMLDGDERRHRLLQFPPPPATESTIPDQMALAAFGSRFSGSRSSSGRAPCSFCGGVTNGRDRCFKFHPELRETFKRNKEKNKASRTAAISETSYGPLVAPYSPCSPLLLLAAPCCPCCPELPVAALEMVILTFPYIRNPRVWRLPHVRERIEFFHNHVKVAVQFMRRVIQKKAKFDIMDLNCIQVAPKTFMPALFGHANDDKFIQPHHSDLIYQSYAGDKNIIKFDGDHNSSRPQFYYDSVSIFFYNILNPPQVSSASSNKLEKYYDLGDLKVRAGMDEGLLYEIIAGLQTVDAGAASSSSAPPGISTTKSVTELLSDVAQVTGVIDPMANQANTLDGDDASEMQDKPIGQNEECCSYTSSNRESWGRCSSLGSNDEPPSDCTLAYSNQMKGNVQNFRNGSKGMREGSLKEPYKSWLSSTVTDNLIERLLQQDLILNHGYVDNYLGVQIL
ncbi:alpha/beta-Hydrolases superfamily protein [Actinidia rufa]|uniref:Alpha/beta-Hydrolases superfamily protein n=1 Tax=Actinidia rufa TaxID=165716 RepID=A0A7J0E1B6_9ERIC|nr:alpha/beta-Hydrolases superfamily protein [Actinidia rufa]